tara:strand:+ start:210 stop:512 length:303 start_codon:yes stop_codon:yes gene_type:complete
MKKYIITTKGDKIKASVLSYKKEKNTATFARSLTLNSNPKSFIKACLSKKNEHTNKKTKAVVQKLIPSCSFAIIIVKFILINKNVSKLTLSVNPFSSLKY